MKFASVLLLFLTKSVWTLLPPDDSSCYNHCYQQPPEACPPVSNPCRCHRLTNCNNAAVCCNVNAFTLTEGLACANISSTTDIKALHIRNATIESFNLTVHQQVWKALLYMTVTDGHIKNIVGKFPKASKISCLNLSSNHINYIEEERSLVSLYNLSFLDLSNNNLTQVPRIRMDNVTLDISNNTNLPCSYLKELFNMSKLTFINENKTFCFTSKDFAWFQTTALLPFFQVKRVHEVQKNCVANCTCNMHRLNLSQGKLPSFEVAVNCSGKKYFTLPVPLPPDTILLDVSNNNITSLKELSHPSYQNLRYFYADNNQIASIQPLEGSKFINNFDTLSLQRNKIKLIETYVLDNIQFERNFNQRKVKLGFNRIQCDCNTKKLKIWLLSKLSHIPDHDEIRCANVDAKVTELDPSQFCQSPQDWTYYINYIITGEVLLLVGLIVKVSYDYWVFTTTGYLPWPASKMPRLPCDWLCE
ncbi:leucine-rich repeat domain-containing protein hfw isoform X2 [Rhynchophorus ferrugineus]